MTGDGGGRLAVTCRSYTAARRYPLVIGRIGGWRPPWGPWTIPQYAAAVVVLLVLVQTRGLWAHFPALVNLAAAGGLPLAAGWSLRRVRVEGRAAHRALLGRASLLLAPRAGVSAGRVQRPAPARRVTGAAAFVCELGGGR